jgi:phage recombination protein Bet
MTMTDASTNVVAIERQPRSVLVDMSGRYGMEPAAFEATLRATVCKGNVSREEFAAFLLVAKEYGLNPVTKELYAFPAKGGGIQPIVSIDGWSRIINDHPMFDGMEFEDVRDGDDLIAITCRMHRKDRSRSIEATEYMKECLRPGEVWKTWPRRMLRHKAMIQCARYAFGFSGIVDPDEYERQMTIRDVTPRASPNLAAKLASPTDGPREGFTAVHGSPLGDDDIPDFETTDHDAETGEVIDDFPGDRPAGEGSAAGHDWASADEGSGSAVATDVVAWADRLIADLPFLSQEALDLIESDRKELAKFAVLKTTDIEKAKELEKAIGDAKAAFK